MQFSTSPWGAVLVVVCFGVPVAVFTSLSIAAFNTDDRGTGGFFAAMSVALFVVGTALACRVRRRGELTADELRVPAGQFGWRKLRLADLNGVGLVFCYQRRVSGWLPFVWSSAGPILIPVGLVPMGLPRAADTADRALTARRLAGSVQGGLCQQIAQRAVAARSGEALLFMMPPAPRSGAQALWSPVLPDRLVDLPTGDRS